MDPMMFARCDRPYTGAKETHFRSKELQHGQQSVRSRLGPGDPAPILSVYAVRLSILAETLFPSCGSGFHPQGFEVTVIGLSHNGNKTVTRGS